MAEPLDRALEYLSTAETALLNYMVRLSDAAEETDEDEVDAPDMIPVFGAVLTNISRAAGIIEGTK